MKKVINETLSSERALFKSNGAIIENCTFEVGESPLKGSSNIELYNCSFKYKYPLWYCDNVVVKDSKWFEMGRSGVWYTNNLLVENCLIEAPKNFRRCKDITLRKVNLPNAAETFWSCDGVVLEDVTAKGDYFAMNAVNLKVNNLKLDGNYPFDGCKNLEIRNSVLNSKDALWNCENVTVYDSYIKGEYLGWNAKNLVLVNCTIESLQGLCYIDNLVMKNCKLVNTTLAFEYSTCDVEIVGKVDSVLNPTSGTIKVDRIGTLIMQKQYIDESKTKIICDVVEGTADEPF